MRTVKLVFWIAVAYGLSLLAVRITLPTESIPAASLTGIPLTLVVVILARDLARRSTGTAITPTNKSVQAPRMNHLRFLSGQFKVAARASDSYFENVVRSRLKELLISKVALETGIEDDAIRSALSKPGRGLKLLQNQELYNNLYGPVPSSEPARMRMIEKSVDLIEAWHA